jgi:DNA-binding NtrC family response regulator
MPAPIDVLVVDDNPDALKLITSELREAGYHVRTACDGLDGWAKFRAKRPDLVVSDIKMPREDGVALLQRIREVSDAPVIMLTALGEGSPSVAALRARATDFLRFPDQLDMLVERAQRLLPERLLGEPDDAATELIPGNAPVIGELRGRVRALAEIDVPVLVTGEVGSGRKNAVAAMHALARNLGPLVELAAEERSLPRRRSALLLLDLEQWSPDTQNFWATTLKNLAGAKISRLFALAGPTLATRVDRLEFRRDLWQRLSRFRLEMPPLRARAQDVPDLARSMLGEVTEALGRPPLLFTPGALDGLRRKPWPGNLPELREVLVQAAVFATEKLIGREDIDRAFAAVLASREDSLSNRRAEKQDADRRRLIELLDSCGGNIAEMGRKLDLTRGAVSYRLRKHGLTK